MRIASKDSSQQDLSLPASLVTSSRNFLCLGFSFLAAKTAWFGFGILVLSAISGCGTYLPSSGPSSARIMGDAQDPKNLDSYRLIPITGEVVSILGSNWKRNGGNSLGTLKNEGTTAARLKDSQLNFRVSSLGMNRLPAAVPRAIAVGDVVQVTIYETGGGLFGSPGPQGVTATSGSQLPPQPVDESGAITVPFAGRLSVKGLSPHAVETEIIEKLKGKAVNPQVIVSVGERRGGNLVTVTGDVRAPTLVPLGFAETRVLDAVTASGGSVGKAHDTIVSVIRGSLLRSDSLADITNNPSKNVALQPGDTVVVKNTPRSYLAFGATGRNARISFDSDQVSLAEALASSGGPMDARSNPSAIYVYRLEPKSLVRKLGHDPKEFIGGAVPVIYNLDLGSPKGFFLARNFDIRDKDIIYFANAGSVGLAKFLSLLNAVTSGIRTEATTAAQLAQ